MSDLNVLLCPFCDKFSDFSSVFGIPYACCVNPDCPICGIFVPLEQWNNRPSLNNSSNSSGHRDKKSNPKYVSFNDFWETVPSKGCAVLMSIDDLKEWSETVFNKARC